MQPPCACQLPQQPRGVILGDALAGTVCALAGSLLVAPLLCPATTGCLAAPGSLLPHGPMLSPLCYPCPFPSPRPAHRFPSSPAPSLPSVLLLLPLSSVAPPSCASAAPPSAPLLPDCRAPASSSHPTCPALLHVRRICFWLPCLRPVPRVPLPPAALCPPSAAPPARLSPPWCWHSPMPVLSSVTLSHLRCIGRPLASV